MAHYITIRRKSELAQTLILSERQVKIWYVHFHLIYVVVNFPNKKVLSHWTMTNQNNCKFCFLWNF